MDCSLRPSICICCIVSFAVSEAPKLAPPPKKYSYDFKAKTDQEKKEELVSAMIDRMAERDQEPLPQDSQEGVDDDEWVSMQAVIYNKQYYVYCRMTDCPKMELLNLLYFISYNCIIFLVQRIFKGEYFIK